MQKCCNHWLLTVLLWLLCGAMSSCSGSQTGRKMVASVPSAEGVQVASPAQTEQEEMFPFPEIPEVLTDPDERRSYLLSHYWDCYDFTDTVLLHHADVTEQGLVNYVALVASHADRGEADRAVDGFCRKMAVGKEAREVFASLLEKYLYDPMSPLRNDLLYVRFLDGLLAYAPQGDILRDRWRFYKDLAGKNNPGQAAENFTYYRPDGTAQTLYGTRAGLLLVLFYDPECENCHATMQAMKDSETLSGAVRNGHVTVLAVYTEGNPAAWREELSGLPSDWLVGTDREFIKKQSLYDLKAMPTLYLLDADKRVLLKDVAFGDKSLEAYLKP